MSSSVGRLGLALVLVVATVSPVTSDPSPSPATTPEEATVAFLAGAIAPDQNSIDYLAAIDLSTGMVSVAANDPPPDPNDAHGRSKVPDCLCTLPSNASEFLTFTADGRRIIGARATRPPAILICDRQSGRCLRQLWHGGRVGGIALSPDGHTLAAAVCAVGGNPQRSGRVSLWDIDSGNLIGQVAVGQPVSTVAFMPDGSAVVTGGDDGLVCLWDLESGEQLSCLGTHNREVTTVAVAPDGRTVASGGNDGLVCLWSVADSKELQRLEHPREVSLVAFAPDGRLLASVSGGTYVNPEGALYLRDTTTFKELSHFQHHPEASRSISFSADGRLLAVTNRSGVHLWEVATGLERHVLDSRIDTYRATHGTAAAFSPDGRTVAASGSFNAVWDVTGRSPNGVLPGARFTQRGLDDLWEALGDREATRAHAAVWALVASRDNAMKLFGDRLPPAAAVDLERVKGLVADLNDASFDVRQAAGRALERLDDVRVADLLRQAIADKPPLELEKRLERALTAFTGMAHPERARALRAVEILERIGSPDARDLIDRLAGGAADSYLTRIARAALERLPKTKEAGR